MLLSSTFWRLHLDAGVASLSSLKHSEDETKRRLESSPNHAASLAHPLSSHGWQPQATKGKQSPSQTPLKFVGLRV